MGRAVVAVGQIPPPVSGLSYITQQAIEVASAKAATVIVNNIAASLGCSGLNKHLSRIFATFRAFWSLKSNHNLKDRTCYVACEGGYGLIYILSIIMAARIYGYDIILHHHSFAYINRWNFLISSINYIGGKSLVHVFLGEEMSDGFRRTYSKNRIAGVEISNAAFVRPNDNVNGSVIGPLVLGHLSNLTLEKGLYTFIELVRNMHIRGERVRGVLAGPAHDSKDRNFIAQLIHEESDIFEYRGAIFGQEKDGFYRDIDVFIFPTQYIHEAQPTVVFEALAAGCQVISFERGCIRGQVQDEGLVVPQDRDFIAESIDWLRLHRSDVRSKRSGTYASYARRHTIARSTAEMLFSDALVPKVE
jgi:glycosyltransferase involved in cell wall biosynthesis